MKNEKEVKKRCTAIILAAGSGSRMKSNVAKQFMLLNGKPLIWYALNAVEESKIIDDCIVVTGKEDIPFVREEIVKKFDFHKVDIIVSGGEERFSSVANAMRVIAQNKLRVPNQDGYVFIHDGARPFLTEEIIKSTYRAVEEYHACVAAVLSKDTIKIADELDYAVQTPNRNRVWNVQTPQVFDTPLIVEAYESLEKHLPKLADEGITMTDDASVVELFTNVKVKMVPASYENIKITTPEDITIAEMFLQNKR